tara:strand:+ start:181 stop:498 length:318 start_codon:yes stop_codon:yes gene_type:complete
MSDEKHNGKFMGLVRGKECYSTDPRDLMEGKPRYCGLCGTDKNLVVMPLGSKHDPYGYGVVCIECQTVKGYYTLFKKAVFESMRAKEALGKLHGAIRAFENLRDA